MDQLRRSAATWKVWGNSLGALDGRADPENLPDGLTKKKWPAETFAQFGSWDFGGNRTIGGLYNSGFVEFQNRVQFNWWDSFTPPATDVRKTRCSPSRQYN